MTGGRWVDRHPILARSGILESRPWIDGEPPMPSAPVSSYRAWSLMSFLVLTLMVVPMVLLDLALLGRSGLDRIVDIYTWFDPLFFQYNVVLWTLFVLLVPFITYFYVENMRVERESRLRAELGINWAQHEPYIHGVMKQQFGIVNYVGSTLTLMTIVGMGLVVMFLLKPVADPDGVGLDYGKGANLFLMGAYMYLKPGGDQFDRVIVSLTAFQFGFLGAYAYFIGHLVRSYFTMDLTPNTFVSMSIRMVTAGLVALVLSFALRDFPTFFGGKPLDEKPFRALLPVVSFGIGFFPDWGLLAIHKVTRRLLMIGREEFSASAMLSVLSGMSYEHEVRLKRQGYDSVENLAEANLVELAVRTGFSYGQLRTWAGEAWLRVRFGRDDYPKLVQATGVRTADQFRSLFGSLATGNPREAARLALESVPEPLRVKINCAALLVHEWQPERPDIGSKIAHA
jgi:hypothetical protein